MLESLDDATFERLVEEGRLQELQGVGPGLAARIVELSRTGRSTSLEALRGQLPPGAGELGRLRLGLGKITALHAALGVETIADLRAACEAGRVRLVKGIGEKTEARILEAIRRLEEPGPSRVLLSDALDAAEPVLEHLRRAPGVTAAELTGDLRRRTETVGRVEVIVASTTPAAARAHTLALPGVVSVSDAGPEAYRAVLDSGLPLEVRVSRPDDHGAELLHATGAPAHVAHLGRLAEARGLRLGRSGLVRTAGGARLLRTGRRGYLPAPGPAVHPARATRGRGRDRGRGRGPLPADLVRWTTSRGSSTATPCTPTAATRSRRWRGPRRRCGMRYLTITDHSPTASYAGGLSVDRLPRPVGRDRAGAGEGIRPPAARDGVGHPRRRRAGLSRRHPRAAGRGDREHSQPPPHERRRDDPPAHPRHGASVLQDLGACVGRLIPSRPPIEVDVEKVLDVAAESRAAIEINGDPHRLDLPPRWLRAARERGLSFVISTDAHATGELDNLRYGVAMARRGWVRRGEVLNTLDAAGFARAVAPAGPR